ncbi:unnamed protein product [Symbiodinium microadriaticum]|nr:unnamed protein product [Symbiodinium microadriaticum]
MDEEEKRMRKALYEEARQKAEDNARRKAEEVKQKKNVIIGDR